MNKTAAKLAIKSLFKRYGASRSASIKNLGKASIGKVYELYVLAELLRELRSRGYLITFSNPGSTLKFKAGPGLLKQQDPHFDISKKADQTECYQIFVNVEFKTLGTQGISAAPDYSARHELDIGVFSHGLSGYPQHTKVALGIECKAVGKLTKQVVRGVLGLRRELSLLCEPIPSVLSAGRKQPANPPSELRLVTTDPRVDTYIQSPLTFGVELQWMKP
jgi:hypothetical protein